MKAGDDERGAKKTFGDDPAVICLEAGGTYEQPRALDAVQGLLWSLSGTFETVLVDCNALSSPPLPIALSRDLSRPASQGLRWAKGKTMNDT